MSDKTTGVVRRQQSWPRVDLRGDGILWMVNRTVFHPRGFALAIDPDTGFLFLQGDGTEPWSYDLTDDDGHDREDDLFAAFDAALARARAATASST